MAGSAETTRPLDPDREPEPVDKAGGDGVTLTELVVEVLELRRQVLAKKE